MAQVESKILKGFRDYGPERMIPRMQFTRRITRVFERFGFAPMDTPALEYSDVLLGKYGGETDKQVFRFLDNGQRDVCLRFDFTVPLARYVAMNKQLPRPIKRYQLGPVWRAENPGRGRFREFTQCDVDIVGTASLAADAECIALGDALLTELGVDGYVVVNNRKVFRGLQEVLEIEDEARMGAVLRAIDKLDKIGESGVREELEREAGLSAALAGRVFAFLSLEQKAPNDAALLDEMEKFFSASHIGRAGVAEICEAAALALEHGAKAANVRVTPSLVRGADYYTGTIFELKLREPEGFGSVGGGGRYDDLIGLYAGEPVPAVGISLGLDRLLAGLEELGRVGGISTTSQVLVTVFSPETRAYAFEIARKLRAAGLRAEVYLDAAAKLRNQLKYASAKSVPFVVIAGPDEQASGAVSLRDMTQGDQRAVTLAELPVVLREKLGTADDALAEYRTWNWSWQSDVVGRVPAVNGLFILYSPGREAVEIGYAGAQALGLTLRAMLEAKTHDGVASFDWYEIADERLGAELANFLRERLLHTPE